MEFRPKIAKPLKIMDSKIFKEEKMGLREEFEREEENATV